MDTQETPTKQRTRKNAKMGSQPPEKAAYVHMTNEQHGRLRYLAGLFFISQEELIRNLIDEKWVQVKSTLPALVSLPSKDGGDLTKDS